ncbi:MAG: tyrosine-type recombinase/integrase [Paludibacter sp.]|nr:tyrosine-type recombinase/integrase [Paludibacter sp.]
MKSTYRVLFYLKKNAILKNGKTIIMIRITINGEIAQLSSKLQVNPDSWDVKTGKVKGRAAEANNINRQLDNLKAAIDKAYTKQFDEFGYVTPEKIKNTILGIDRKYKTLLEYFDMHNKQYAMKIGYSTSNITYNRYLLLRERLEFFMKEHYNISDIDINEVTPVFLDSFYIHIRNQYNSAHNNAMKAMQRLRKIFYFAKNTGLNIPDPFWDFNIGFETAERDFLSQKEIETIQSKQFVSKRVEQVRDLFIFCCYTGLSYIDLCNLKDSNIHAAFDNSLWIMSKRQKTNVQFNVRLLNTPIQILDKYKGSQKDGKILPVISNQKLNEYLKEIGDLCSITKNLTFHMARHTFATTIALSNGVPIETVSKMLGHKSIKTTQIYAKITDIKMSNDMQKLSEIIDKEIAC